jgi:hypothetical protein
MGLNERSLGLDQCIFNRTCDFGREHRSGVYRSRDRLLPSLQHLIHLPPYTVINQSICLHESRVELPAKEESVWSTNILDDGIEDVESG